jgi:murein DD-endopeptidase MepM/ murein hydrolase activator NlpD
MHARSATCVFAAFLLATSPLRAQTVPTGTTGATAARARIVAPERLRQGDPLLAWIVVEAAVAAAPAAGLEARLVDASGKAVLVAPCFAASALLDGEAGAPLSAGNAAQVTVRPESALAGVLMAISPDLPPGAYRLLAAGSSATVVVEPRSFPYETIALNEANSRLRTLPSERKVEEARKLYAILDTVDDSALFAEPSSFLFPVEGGWKSAGFGDRRRYLYADGSSERSVHEGVDWAVVAGTAVRACARGKVVLAAYREVTGNTVVIEHLPGLYSLYFHLSSIEVAEGAVVGRGAVIALSGSTGMATGPHLHWELRAMGDAVDPTYWLGPPLLDKAVVAAIMNGLIEGR